MDATRHPFSPGTRARRGLRCCHFWRDRFSRGRLLHRRTPVGESRPATVDNRLGGCKSVRDSSCSITRPLAATAARAEPVIQ